MGMQWGVAVELRKMGNKVRSTSNNMLWLVVYFNRKWENSLGCTPYVIGSEIKSYVSR